MRPALSVAGLARRGLAFHWRSHLAVLAGAAVAGAILTGALLVGDSVRATLARLVDLRLGAAEVTLDAGDRFVRAELADELAAATAGRTAAVLRVEGVAISGDGRLRAERVQVAGVDDGFWALFGVPPAVTVEDGAGAVNRHLAQRLALGPGDEVVLRLARGDRPPGELSLSSSDRHTALRLGVGAVVEDDAGGRFSLRAEQVAPLTVFVPRALLAEALGVAGRANLILAADAESDQLDRALAGTWRLDDAGLGLRPTLDGGLELVSDRVLLEAPVVAAAARLAPPGREVFTYLVNTLAVGGRATPYSFVAGLDGPPAPARDDAVVINRWLADDLGAAVGDRLTLTWFAPTSEGGLVERESPLEITAVVPLEGAAADPDLVPHIPGLSDSDSCRDWDPGIPIDLDRVRDHDEDYWDRHRGTPKAFLTLATARELWSNRYGTATAIRFPGAGDDRETLARALLGELSPHRLGLSFEPAREDGLVAGSGGVDFGQLFLGLSFFIIAAALLLVGLLFALSIRQRAGDAGILGAVGIGRRRVLAVVAVEGLGVALVGTGLGALLGVVYNLVVLGLLGTVWRGAVGVASLDPTVAPSTVVTGWAISATLAGLVVVAVARVQVRRTPLELLGRGEDPPPLRRGRSVGISLAVAVTCLAAALATVLAVGAERGPSAAAAFWVAGCLMLTAVLAAGRALLLGLGRRSTERPPTLRSLGVANAARKARRPLVAATLLASGVFIVVAVGANRHGQPDPERRSAGTGGFAFYAETTLPVFDDLADPAVLRRLGLDGLGGDDVVRLRLREGDDASCLNLNRVATPGVLGLDPEAFARRGAFTFAALADHGDPDDPWRVLTQPLADGAIPAVADQSVIQWGLGLALGDDIVVVGDDGEDVVLRLVGGLANSVFQGRLLIAEDAFTAAFPHASGQRVLLVDSGTDAREEVAAALTRALRDHGLVLETAAHRLAGFTVVETTYLSIFLALGGLGLVIGTLGLGVIVLRDVIEQRGALAVLRAVGLSRRQVQRTLLAELGVILALGLGGGVVAALVAVLPALRAPGGAFPVAFLSLTLAAIATGGVLSALAASRLATAGDPLPALRTE